jgi:hypothetical protein
VTCAYETLEANDEAISTAVKGELKTASATRDKKSIGREKINKAKSPVKARKEIKEKISSNPATDTYDEKQVNEV